MKIIEIDYKPRSWALELHEHVARYKVIVAHRRSGKTVASLNHLQRDALHTRNSRFAYISPTYKQSKNIAWDLLKHYSQTIPNIKINEAELRVDYPNGARITLYGADNPDSLRGIGLNGVVFDEYSQQPGNIFSEIIRPALADTGGYSIWIGTPKGKNDFYRLYEYAQTDKDWLAMHLTVEETNVLPIQEIEDAKKIMTEDEFQQEFYCSFTAAIQGAYYSKELDKARTEGRITTVPYDEYLPVYTFWDIGVSDATAIGFFQKLRQEWHLFDYYENSGESLSHYLQVLQDKKYCYGGHYVPHDAAARSVQTGKTYVEIAKDLGWDFNLVPRLDVNGGINNVRMNFSKLWIDEKKCSKLIDALYLYRKEWDDKRGEFRNRPFHDWTCLAGNTKVRTLKGWIPIKEVEKGDYVWGYSHEQKRLLPAIVSDSKKTGENVPLIKVQIDNGKHIKATPEHLWLLRSGEYKRTDELEIGDSLMPFYEMKNRNYIRVNLNDGSFADEHRFVYSHFHGQIDGGKHIDHIDGNHFNNNPDNLRQIDKDLHCGDTFRGKNSEERKKIDKTDYTREFYDGAELYQFCKMCNKKYWGLYKTVYCSDKCKNDFRKKRDSEGLVPSRRNHKIIHIEKAESEDVYDLTVPDLHNFVAEGIVVHNSHGADMLRYWAITEILEEQDTEAYIPHWSGGYLKRSGV